MPTEHDPTTLREIADEPEREREMADELDGVVGHVAANIRAIRAYRGLTQAEVAARAGIHPGTLGRIERGKLDPRLRTMARLGYALGVGAEAMVARWGFLSPTPAKETSDGD